MKSTSLLQWKDNVTKGKSAGKICSPYQGLVIWRFFTIYLTSTETRDILRSAKDLPALYKGLIFRGSSVLKKSKLEAVIKTYPVRYPVMLMQISNSPAVFQAKHRTTVIFKVSPSKRRGLMCLFSLKKSTD